VKTEKPHEKKLQDRNMDNIILYGLFAFIGVLIYFFLLGLVEDVEDFTEPSKKKLRRNLQTSTQKII